MSNTRMTTRRPRALAIDSVPRIIPTLEQPWPDTNPNRDGDSSTPFRQIPKGHVSPFLQICMMGDKRNGYGTLNY
jgi:hypothetical protein